MAKQNFKILFYFSFFITMPYFAFGARMEPGISDRDEDKYDRSDGRRIGVLEEFLDLRKERDLENKNITEVFKKALKDGFHGGIKETTRQVVTSLFKVVPFATSQLLPFSSALIYRFVFGTKGLTKTDLVRISNRIYSICSPFASLSIGNLDKKRRLALLKRDGEVNAEDKTLPELNNSWEFMRNSLIEELRYAIVYLKKNRVCYDLKYLDSHRLHLRYQLAFFVHLTSSEDYDHIAFYITRAIDYIEQLIVLFENCKCEEQVYELHEQIKRYLNWTIGALEQISFFIDIAKTKTTYTSTAFKNVNMGLSSGMPALESLSSKDPLL